MCCFYEAKTLKLDNSKVQTEPEILPDIPVLRNQFAGKKCPLCQGFGRLKCRHCQEGRVAFLGGFQECSSCRGASLKACPVCSAHGFLKTRDDDASATLEPCAIPSEPIPA